MKKVLIAILIAGVFFILILWAAAQFGLGFFEGGEAEGIVMRSWQVNVPGFVYVEAGWEYRCVVVKATRYSKKMECYLVGSEATQTPWVITATEARATATATATATQTVTATMGTPYPGP